MLSGVASPTSYLTLIMSMITECIPCPNQPPGTMQLILIGDLGSRVFWVERVSGTPVCSSLQQRGLTRTVQDF